MESSLSASVSALDPRLRNAAASRPGTEAYDNSSISVAPTSSTTTSAALPQLANASSIPASAIETGLGSHAVANVADASSSLSSTVHTYPAAAATASAHSTPSSASSPDPSRPAHGLAHANSFPTHHDHAVHTSPTASLGPHDENPGDDNGEGGADAKKPRACEACRGLKVRCEPDPSNPDGACKRCAKANRNCVVTQPTRKRQKKTDSRVAELEKKIDALTATLSATKAGQAGHPMPGMPDGAGGIIYYGGGMDPPRPWSAVNAIGLSRDAANIARSQNQSPYADGNPVHPPPMVLAGQKRKYPGPREYDEDAATPSVAPSATDTRSHEYSDIVDRGIISMERANVLWDRYNYQMAPFLPGCVFSRDMTVAELRKTKPILFLAIMSAASSETPNVQRVVVKELMQVFADKIMVTGEKSIEIVQALNISVIWYWPPEHFEELKFYEMVHLAAVMAIDLGLGKRKSRRAKNLGSNFRDHPFRKHPPPDPTTVEARRTWLMCYFLTTNTAMALHRPFLLRWTSFMAECLDVLESSPEAAPSDKYFCHLVRTHQLAEEIGFQFCMEDPTVSVNLSDYMTQHKVRGFERELEKHRQEVSRELMQPSLKFSFHTINLYMHELALQNEPADAFKAPFAAESLRDSLVSNAALTPAYTNALAACLTAIDGIFDTFFSLDPSEIRCLPVLNFVRVAYATVVLIRIYFAASSSISELGKIIDRDSMKVDQHLENLLEKFKLTAADDKSRPASKFLVALVMIRSWFHKIAKGELNPTARIVDAANAAEGVASPFTTPDTARVPGDGHTPGSAANPGYSAHANSNPLQLLSEAATHNQAAAINEQMPRPGGGNGHVSSSSSSSNNNNNSNAWYGQMGFGPEIKYNQHKPSSASSDNNMPPPPQPFQPATVSGSPAPWMNFGQDMDYSNMGDGFAQAFDVTLQNLNEGSNNLQDLNGLSLMANDPLFAQFMGDFPGSDFFQF